ncbi:hypothetical protein GCM10009854_46880 [Saccharopolyspora halophila]|uniref:DUF3040 domain-containing protein n=1 Tax=Saccharopolyspora halophila TaxID=405551 RepID=A0ABN3GV41_9PSEU
MLPREERRRLQEIEQQLAEDDPRLARKMDQTSTVGYLRARLSTTNLLAVFSGVLAVICLFLGEGGAMLTAVFTAGLLLAANAVQLRLS